MSDFVYVMIGNSSIFKPHAFPPMIKDKGGKAFPGKEKVFLCRVRITNRGAAMKRGSTVPGRAIILLASLTFFILVTMRSTMILANPCLAYE